MKPKPFPYEKIASDVWPAGARLVCQQCAHRLVVTSEECGEYLRTEWPTCCSETMLLTALEQT